MPVIGLVIGVPFGPVGCFFLGVAGFWLRVDVVEAATGATAVAAFGSVANSKDQSVPDHFALSSPISSINAVSSSILELRSLTVLLWLESDDPLRVLDSEVNI